MNLELKNCILIGDSASDIQAGIAAGVGTNLLFSKHTLLELSGLSYRTIATLREALSFMNSSCQKGVGS